MKGESFDFLQELMKSSLIEQKESALDIFKSTSIFARMKPHHKSQVVLLLKEFNQAVMMVGGNSHIFFVLFIGIRWCERLCCIEES